MRPVRYCGGANAICGTKKEKVPATTFGEAGILASFGGWHLISVFWCASVAGKVFDVVFLGWQQTGQSST